MDSREEVMLKRRENGMMLSDKQVSVLEFNNINYNNHKDIKSLIFEIESVLNDNYDDSLEELY